MRLLLHDTKNGRECGYASFMKKRGASLTSSEGDTMTKTVTLTVTEAEIDLAICAMKDSANELIACGDDGLAEQVLKIAERFRAQLNMATVTVSFAELVERNQ